MRVMPSRTLPVFLALSLAALSGRAQKVDDLVVPKDRCVIDNARVFTPMHLRQIYDVCTRLDRAGVAQIGVAAVSSLGDRSRAEYAVDLFKKWGLGHGKGRDDGLLVLLSPSERGTGMGIRVEVGYGLEGILPDGKVGALIDQLYMPHRQRGQPGTGAVELVRGLAAVIAKDAAAGGDAAATEASKKDGERSGRTARTARGAPRTPMNAGALGLGILSMLVLLITLATSATRRSFPGKGTGALAALLVIGTIVGLASMTAAVGGWIAFIIGLVVNGITYASIRSHKCPKDGSWMTIEEHVVEEPTYLTDGIAEVTERCTSSACGYERTFEKVLPHKEVHVVTTGGGYGGGSSGGSSYDNDSFSGGGGESGGGGAERD